jgi:hypothetical protein
MQDHRNRSRGERATTLQLSAAEAAALAQCGMRAAEGILEKYSSVATRLEDFERIADGLQAPIRLMRAAEERRLDRSLNHDDRVMDVLWDSLGQTAHMAMAAIDDDWEPDSQVKCRKAWQIEANLMHRLND